MERIGFLINKLKEQYEKAESQDSMLVTLQMLYRELMPKMDGNNAIGKISVVLPGQMDLSFLEKNLNQKSALDVMPNANGKQVFELSLDSAIAPEPIQIQQVVKPQQIDVPGIVEPKPITIQSVTAVDLPKNPFVTVNHKVENPLPKPESIITENKPETFANLKSFEIINDINSRFMPPESNPLYEKHIETKPIILDQPMQPMPQPIPKITHNIVPPKEVHEAIPINNQPSLNDNIEKRQPELFNILKTEPLKDLKKAISINERFQYINQLFMKDETMYERSLKTINSFNVFSEAQYWIRKELATKMGWRDDDEVVQQFMALVERRFS